MKRAVVIVYPDGHPPFDLRGRSMDIGTEDGMELRMDFLAAVTREPGDNTPGSQAAVVGTADVPDDAPDVVFIRKPKPEVTQ